MPVLDDIKGFVAVAQTGGFARAARRLAVSTSVVSRRIDRLEAELGVCLILRTTHGLSLTPAGNEFYRRSLRILRELDNAYQAVADNPEDIAGSLRISAPYSFGIRHLEPVLSRLSDRYPLLEFDISYSDRYVDLLKESFDAVIRIGVVNELNFAARRIAPMPTLLVASPAYLAAHGAVQTPEDIARHQCLIYSGRTHAEWVFQQGDSVISVMPTGRFHSDSGEALLNWAVSGRGLAVLPYYMARDAMALGSLTPLLPSYTMPEYELYILRPPGVRVAGQVRALIDALVNYCADALAHGTAAGG